VSDRPREPWRALRSLIDPRSHLSKLGRPAEEADDLGRPGGARGRLGVRDVVLNPPLMLGLIVVLVLLSVVLFGPIWAPTNPYIAAQHLVPHYDVERGEYISPPLAPSAEYPLGTDRWGNDLLSMLMHGARNTLVACAFITMARVGLGLTLGGIAGWNEGKRSDQAIMGAIGVITSLPTLISSIVLIYALDIRKGLPVFILALSAVGWTEIAQYVRGEFLVLRKRPFIEGARAVGLRGFAVAVRHVLPNILPQLLVIASLEMGAVMMLLGELGFVGVYIGGGSRIAVETDPFQFEFFTLVEVPEWGAMLADGFRWLRSRPFVVWPPAVAFFVSVVGFNALGEGLRRLLEKGSINTAFLMRKEMLLVVVVLTASTVLVIQTTGPAPWFSRVAQAFNGRMALEHVQALAAMEGRGAGQPGAERAAAYIADRFEAYGLEPAWKNNAYRYPLDVTLVRPVEQPVLALVEPGGRVVRAFQHQVEFGAWLEGHGGSGDVEAPLTLVGFDPAQGGGGGTALWASFKGLDLRDRIVLLVRGNAPSEFANEALIRGARGVLWVVGDGPEECRTQVQVLGPESTRKPHIPVFCVRPGVADELTGSQWRSVEEPLRQGAQGAPDGEGVTAGPGWFARDIDSRVHMELRLGEPQKVEVPCVLGYKRGSDHDLTGQLVILFAAYDGLGIDPDGTIYPAANQGASGVGVLLELARLWQEQDLDARRSVLFVAWGGGQLQDSGAKTFLSQVDSYRHLPATAPNRPTLFLQLDRVGAGGDELWIHPDSSRRLETLIGQAVEELGGATTQEEGESGGLAALVRPSRIPWAYLAWADSYVPPDQDTIERIDEEKLQSVGEMLALALTRVVRQTTY
jgi:peptide/nickel transport system permease protein